MSAPYGQEGALQDRLRGAAAFAFIPATLWMMLRLPLGTGPSLLVAAGTIAAHRPLASRFVFERRARRCLWCGGFPRDGVEVSLQGVPSLRVCAAEAGSLDRFLAFCAGHALALRLGILVPVFGYFLLGALSVMGFAPVSLEARKHLFRGLVALSVLGVALLHRRSPARRPPSFPFPIHNLALLGVRATLLVFLGVGLYWLGLTVLSLF